MMQIRKVNRSITKSDRKMEKECTMKVEKISTKELKEHSIFGEVVQALIDTGFEGTVFELHCNGIHEMMWIKEDFGLNPGTDQKGNRVFGITVNTKIDEGLIGAFIRILERNNIKCKVTHGITFNAEGHPTIQPAIVQTISKGGTKRWQ